VGVQASLSPDEDWNAGPALHRTAPAMQDLTLSLAAARAAAPACCLRSPPLAQTALILSVSLALARILANPTSAGVMGRAQKALANARRPEHAPDNAATHLRFPFSAARL